MRVVLTLAAALIAGTLAFYAGTHGASASPLPAFATLDAAPSAVQTVGWRQRYYRRYGVWPTGPVVDVGPPDVVVVPDDDVVVVVPLRPLSCGEYHYWNGVACVDARYNDPYLGPK